MSKSMPETAGYTSARREISHPHWCKPSECEASEDGTSITHRTAYYRQAQRIGVGGWEPVETPLAWVRVSQMITTQDEAAAAMRVDVKLPDNLTPADLATAADQLKALAHKLEVIVAPTFDTPCPAFCQHDEIEPPKLAARGHRYEVVSPPSVFPLGTRTRWHWGVVGRRVMLQYEIVHPDGTVVLREPEVARCATAADLEAIRPSA